jgi:hypothetical protein
MQTIETTRRSRRDLVAMDMVRAAGRTEDEHVLVAEGV